MTNTPYTIIRADGAQEVREAVLGEHSNYEALQALLCPLLDCDYAEHVRVLHNGEYLDLFVDEDGLHKDLPRNELATTIYRNNVMTHEPDTDPESLPFIAGDAVLFDRKVWN